MIQKWEENTIVYNLEEKHGKEGGIRINETVGKIKDVHLMEHLDMAVEHPVGLISFMKDPYITDQDIKTRLKKTKNRKAAGPDGIKIELFKVMIDSSICMRNLRVCLNNTLNSGEHSKPKG